MRVAVGIGSTRTARIRPRAVPARSTASFATGEEVRRFAELVSNVRDRINWIGNLVDHDWFPRGLTLVRPCRMTARISCSMAIWIAGRTPTRAIVRPNRLAADPSKFPWRTSQIAGANPPSDVQRPAALCAPVNGRVPDMRPSIAHADVSVVTVTHRACHAQQAVAAGVASRQAFEGVRRPRAATRSWATDSGDHGCGSGRNDGGGPGIGRIRTRNRPNQAR
jgi:hypothetical protein